LTAVQQTRSALVDVLQEVLGGGLEQQNLVVVVPVVAEVAALLTDELIMHAAVGYVVSTVVRAQDLFGLGLHLLQRSLAEVKG